MHKLASNIKPGDIIIINSNDGPDKRHLVLKITDREHMFMVAMFTGRFYFDCFALDRTREENTILPNWGFAVHSHVEYEIYELPPLPPIR